jgi:hypothetical protein
MANVLIDIAAEFVGNKAFKQADSATDKLTKNVRKLAGAFGLAFSTTAVLAYGKAAVKAAAEDQKAQQGLALALKNVGLERDAASAEGFIQRLQSEFGIIDDKLRPAYQALAVATRDTAETQRLLNLALDISASTGNDLGKVTAALSRAYLGNNTALSRLGVGISKADLKTKSFYDITTDLAETFKGSATAAANTFQGSMDKLAVASANVQEIIGTGIIDALGTLGGNTAVDDLADDMERAALGAADFLRGLAQIGTFKVSGETKSLIGLLLTPFQRSLSAGPLGAITRLGAASRIEPKPFTTPMTVSGQTQVRQQAQITKLTQQQAVAQNKITKDKRVQQAIDKANLALLKGEEVFDLDKIQIAAALTNQAQQLGKATSAAQVLQIANDTARLNVKKSILELEDAIAAKDETAIIKATAKLNEDLKILNALSGQKNQMAAIESILAGLKPKDLIDQKNLDEALRKIKQMMEDLAKIKFPTPSSSGGGGGGSTGGGSTGGSTTILGTAAIEALTAAQAEAILATMPSSVKTNLTAAQISGNRYEAQAEAAFTKMVEQVGLATQTAQSSFLNGIQAGLNIPAALSGSRYAAQAQAAAGGQGYVINIQTGVGDPNAIAEAIDEVLRQARDRGTLTAV